MRTLPAGARRLAAATAAVATLVLASCATQPAVAPQQGFDAALVEAPFTAGGRLSARHGADAVAVQFRWRHAPPRDELVVMSPLGQTLAELTGDASAQRVEVRTSDGRQDSAADWTTLTARVLGFPLPVAGLAAWLRAMPRPGAPYTIEPDRDGRAGVLRQDGWEIVYDYPDAAALRPSRLRVSYPEFEIRIVVDTWQ